MSTTGVDCPHIRITHGTSSDAPGTILLDIDLPFCAVHGEKENWEEKSLIHECINIDSFPPSSFYLKNVKGFYDKFSLDYTDKILKVEHQQIIASIYNLQQGNTIFFTPHKDYIAADGIYDVIIWSSNLELLRMTGGTPMGNYGNLFELKTRTLHDLINIRVVPDPAAPVYYIVFGEYQIT